MTFFVCFGSKDLSIIVIVHSMVSYLFPSGLPELLSILQTTAVKLLDIEKN